MLYLALMFVGFTVTTSDQEPAKAPVAEWITPGVVCTLNEEFRTMDCHEVNTYTGTGIVF